MLEIKPQGKIVRKIVRAKTGELVSAVFLVVESHGDVEVQLLSVSPIGTSEKANSLELKADSSLLCLQGKCLKSPSVISYRRFYSVVSPFFNNLEFFVSQPTRAPSVGSRF